MSLTGPTYPAPKNPNPKAQRSIPAQVLQEGAGVTVHRTLGSGALRNYDPFLLLDMFHNNDPDQYIAGFPSHPHRGFCTFTYMIEGQMEHKDSMGNTGLLGPGSAQLMKAASGVIHSEMPKQRSGMLRGFQLWINLPAANKMDDPTYQEFQGDEFPVVVRDDYSVKVLMGQFLDALSPISDEITHTHYFDITLERGGQFKHHTNTNHNSMIFLFEGSGSLNGQPIPRDTLVTLSSSDHHFNFKADGEGARILSISGKPINEPIVQYGPFVMNSGEEIEQAISDYRRNRLVLRKRAVITK